MSESPRTPGQAETPGGALDYYQTQSVLTDPRSETHLYSDLPRGARPLAVVVQGVLIPPYDQLLDLYGVKDGEFDNARFGVRRAEDFLRRIQKRHPGPLSVPRPPKDRIGAICRNFTFLHVSMLRHQGIPSRCRVGFAGYLDKDPEWWCDHRITEWWDATRKRWVLHDPWVDDVRKKAEGLSIDTFDLRPSGKFLVAGEAWQRCRKGTSDPQTFGDSDTDRGLPPVRYALLHDLAYLNKFEILGNDDWGGLITKPEAELTTSDLEFLDHVAELTLDPDVQLESVRQAFSGSPYGMAVEERVQLLEGGATES